MKNYLIIISLVLFFMHSIHGKTYYVTPNGNDDSIGTESKPWKTIQKAAETVTAGDTVYILAGTYKERITVQHSGVENNFIVFINYKNDEVFIDGSDTTWWRWNGLFDVSGKSYIEINGLNITNSYYSGIWVDSSSHITIKNNYTYNTFSSGIGIWNSKYITIYNNEVELACNDGEQECISIANSNNCEIYNNHIHNNGAGTKGGEGIDIKQGSHNINIYKNLVHHLNNRIGIYADAWDQHTYNINIFQNIVHHCSESGVAIASEKGGVIEKVNIFNNLIYFNKYGGIEIGDWSDINFPGIKPIENIKIINNTCYKNGAYDEGWGFGIFIDNPHAENIIIRNNICSQNNAQLAISNIAKDSTGIGLYKADHNLIDGNNDAPFTISGSDSVLGNPLFADTSIFDFNLQNNSPAIDNGNLILAPNRDFANNLRPQGKSVDIGAYEFSQTVNVKNKKHPQTNENIEVYPNPFVNKLNVIINGKKHKNYTLKIYSITGELVKTISTGTINNGTILIDRDNLATGLYFLNIQADNKIITTKKIILK